MIKLKAEFVRLATAFVFSSRESQRGSVLVMATVLSFAMFVTGLSYLSLVDGMIKETDRYLRRNQSVYGANAKMVEEITYVKMNSPGGDRNSRRIRYYDNVDYQGVIKYGGTDEGTFGWNSDYTVSGIGFASSNIDNEYKYEISTSVNTETFADYLYLSDVERDPVRREIIRFWTPDTLDGRVHSNDTLHISGSPRFMKRVTSFARVIDPPNNYASFDEGLGLNSSKIMFPNQANEIRYYSAFSDWGTSTQDSLTEITFSGPTIYRRYCGYDINGDFDCTPSSIHDAFQFPIPASGAIFIQGKVMIKADRNHSDIMDPSFISLGFEGQLTIASSDTMIIPDNLVYRYANPNYTVPFDTYDVLGLISENYIMFGEDVDNYIYVNAAMAAINGSITVQDIYRYGSYNEKQSLFIYGSLAQRNRGLVHSSYNGGLRGFIEKDYHYDYRLQTRPPPHFLPTSSDPTVYYETFYE